MVYETQQAQIDRRNALAQALMSQGQFGAGDVNRVASGGLAVPISPFAAAAKLFQSGFGAYEQSKAQKEEDSLTDLKASDKKQTIDALTNQLAGPSNMAMPTDPNAPPVGQTTDFSQGTTPVAQAQTDPNALPVEQNQRRAALASILKNANQDDVIKSLMGPTLQKFEPPKPQVLADGGQLVSTDPFTGKTTVDAENAKDIKPPVEDRALVNIVDLKAPNGFRSIERQHFKEGKDQLYQKPDQATLVASGLSGNALTDAATRFRLTGELPTGMRSAPAIIKIMNEAANQADLTGDSSAARTIRQKVGKTAAGALQKFESTNQALMGFEKLATKSADLAESLSVAIPRTNSALWNTWKQKFTAGDKSLYQDPTLKPFQDQIDTFTSEYGKIMSGSMGNTALSDTASKKAQSMISSADSPATFRNIMATLRLDMANRVKSQGEERQDLLNQIGGTGVDVPGAATPAVVAPPAATAGAHPEDIQALLNKYK